MWRIYVDGTEGELLEIQTIEPGTMTPLAAASKYIQDVRRAGGVWNHNIRLANGGAGASGWFPFHSIRVFRVEEVT